MMTKTTSNGEIHSENNSSSSPLWLRIIHINDVYEIDNFVYFKTLVDESKKKEEDRGIDKLIVVLGGDFLGPSLLSNLDHGRGMVDMMEMCGVTHVCFGNHETDVPPKELAARINTSAFCWLNTNMTDIDSKIGCATTPQDIVEVERGIKNEDGTTTYIRKNVCFLGLLTEDPSVYRPGSFGGATIEPVLECTEKYLKDNEETFKRDNVDLIIPLTHQNIPRDRIFAKKFTGETFPLVLGAHDHEAFDETHDGCRVIKVGFDAINTAIIDLKWEVGDENSTNKPTISAKTIPTNTYAKCPETEHRMKCHKHILKELEKAKIFRIEDWVRQSYRRNSTYGNTRDEKEEVSPFLLSTVNNRLGYSNGSEILCSMLRMGMRADLCLVNAGSIRGNVIYPKDQEWFTWSDLKAEIPFPTLMVVIYLPGQVLEDTLTNSRKGVKQTPPVASGAYLHHCDQIHYDNDMCKLISVGSKPFDPAKLYLAALPQGFLKGMDNHTPLLEHIKDIENLPLDHECGIPAKVAFVELFSAMIWLDMGSFDEIDTDGDGFLTREEVRERVKYLFGKGRHKHGESRNGNRKYDDEVADLVVDNVMSIADIDGDGKINPIDMMVTRYVATDMLNHVSTNEEVDTMSQVVKDVMRSQKRGSVMQCDVNRIVRELRNVVDVDRSGTISRTDAMNAIGEVRRRSLLT